MKYMFLIFFVAAMLVAGCASRDGLTPHETMQAPSLPGADIVWPRSDWWRTYGDDQLDRLIVKALADNPGLHLAHARVAAAQAAAGLAAGGERPQLGIDGTAQRTRFTERQFIPPPYAGNWYWNAAVNLDLNWDLDLWGAQHEATVAARREADAVRVEDREAALALQTAVIRTYVKLWASENLRALAQQALAREQQLYAIARAAHEAGLGTGLDVDQAQATLPEARARLIALDANRLRLRNALAALCGETPDALGDLAAARLDADHLPTLPTALPADLLGHRPDVLAARLQVEAARHAVASARARFYPDVNLAAFVGVQSLNLSTLFTGPASQAGIGPALSLPLFTGGRLRAGLSAADAGADAAVDRYNATVLRAVQQTADALERVDAVSRERGEVTQALAVRRQAYDRARRGVHAGLDAPGIALKAQGPLLLTEARAVALDADQLDAYAVLMQTLGGGAVSPRSDGAAP